MSFILIEETGAEHANGANGISGDEVVDENT